MLNIFVPHLLSQTDRTKFTSIQHNRYRVLYIWTCKDLVSIRKDEIHCLNWEIRYVLKIKSFLNIFKDVNVIYTKIYVRQILSTNILNSVWWHKNITKNRKLYIYQTIIQSILVYGAEVWQIPTREINKILSTEMDVLRSSARKSRMEHRVVWWVLIDVSNDYGTFETALNTHLMTHHHIPQVLDH